MIKHALKLPLMLVLIFVLVMYAFELLGLRINIVIPFQLGMTLLFLVFGVSIIAVGGYYFRKVKTTVNPLTPEKSTKLVTTGIYGISRNPMYIGFLFWLVSGVVFFGNLLNVILLPVFVVMVNRLYIIPEEVSLEKLFKDNFYQYKMRVKRWV